MRVFAVDWSGKRSGAEEFIWLAEARDGDLVDLRNGFSRGQAISRLVDAAENEPDTVVGLDFAFSFPRWWCEQEGWADARTVWEAMKVHGDDLLAACGPPQWGRPGKRNPHAPERSYRRTDREAGAGYAKSVFQVGGAGAVGTGSIRGMPHLLTLAEAGFSVWPFDPSHSSRVVEIYPRALTGAVRKSRWSDRHAYLFKRFPDQSKRLLERAAGSEDAFDAAVSAITMSQHASNLAALPHSDDPFYSIEGRIWRSDIKG